MTVAKRRSLDTIPERLNELSGMVVDAALTVHRELGPGLLESVYEVCLCEELDSRGVTVQRQVPVPVTFRGKELDAALRIDLLVENVLVIELKSVDSILPVHHAQMLSYLKLSGHRLGLLINFNVPLLKSGIHRFAH
ncbi:MAG: GxxExxY protein [Firmicutes bacterium]|nr:GxxExxY protein [Bacillota bacterium]